VMMLVPLYETLRERYRYANVINFLGLPNKKYPKTDAKILSISSLCVLCVSAVRLFLGNPFVIMHNISA
ncbi:hypothetical protein KBT16_10850, partial [Nostoc sp. CCCryo 231-06]|nr:hypothetical protein [Nostoc sp. CCCryo 231-06]